MDATSTVSVWVKAPPERIFPYVADVRRHGEWTKDPLQIEGPEPGPGAEYHCKTRFLGKPAESDIRVTDYQPNSHLAFDVTQDGKLYHHEFSLRPERDGTTVERSIRLPHAGPIGNAFLKYVIAPGPVRVGTKRSLGMLKQIAER